MLLATLIVAVLALAAIAATALVIPARVSDLHASVVSCFETIERSIGEGRAEDPRTKLLVSENGDLRHQVQQAHDRIMALTHPAYLREFRRDQVAAAAGKVREEPQFIAYDEFGGEMPAYPKDHSAFSQRFKTAPSVAPSDAEQRPAPAKAAS